MGTLLDETALRHYTDVVCFLNGRELVSDANRRTIHANVVKRLLYDFLGSRVQCTGRFIEQ